MIERGIAVPEKFKPPETSPDSDFYIQACMHLFSCRGIGMALGPVPWTAIYDYCQAVGFANWERLFSIVTTVDNALRDDEKA